MHGLLNISFILIFFVLLVVSFYCGKYISRLQFSRRAQKNITSYKIFESAIFALMGLLVAFTFSNANQKLDQRRHLIIEEANAVSTAYLRLDLLQQGPRASLRNDFKEYLAARIEVYNAIPDFDRVMQNISKSNGLQSRIWERAVNDCKASSQQSACMLLLPALNNMFDIASTRVAVTKIHPPLVIFYLLIGLALLSCFLAGYDMEYEAEGKTSIFIISYTIVISLTIYMIINMEYPRLGVIQLKAFDSTLVELFDKM